MLQFKQGTAFMKAALPFVDPVAREKLGLMIQAGELIGSMEQMAEMPLSACDFNSTPIDIEGMLSAFLPSVSYADVFKDVNLAEYMKVDPLFSKYHN